MDYAIMFSLMGVTILFLSYLLYQSRKQNYMQMTLLRAVIEGQVEIRKTANGAELIMKKEV